MSKELPLKVRMDIRDQWDNAQSSVREAIATLKKVLGHTIEPRIEWPLLWGALKEKFPDNTVFVPTIVRYTISWYERLSARLENEAYADWAEQLLEALQDGRWLSLTIEAAESKVTRPVAKWEAKFATFNFYIPKTEPVSQAKLETGLDKDLENLFNDDAKDDDWAEVKVEAISTRPTLPPARVTAVAAPIGDELPIIERMPVLDGLARPNQLFQSTAPYILIVEERGATIVVQSSHESSLELLSSYLNKWSRGNPNDSQRRAILKVDLLESESFQGMFDTLTVERTMARNNGQPINPAFILAFVEGVLGYQLVSTVGACKTYKSTTLLK
ncbi:hypothetical protein MIND_00361600 [Mycena indigotica]|uniref:Uncharacterized protein n=1 Tax=Mycena indigotica TaxID=2126181 RepID=A0A8H6T2Q9_9AGAR|nr:uncharacterized protein MIND_00361600 [Mycena indigotica]KAF7309893.1 hypothetical protein MIND_00361600 [Mycena indigotica]